MLARLSLFAIGAVVLQSSQGLAAPSSSPKQQPRAAAIDTSTLNGKFFVGYQAWFRKPNEDNGNSHWTTRFLVGVDTVPDVTGYPQECLFDTPFIKPDGSAAQFYTNDCEGVVDLHFKMMSDQGISGAFLQRFYEYINQPNGGWDKILEYSKTAAEKYGRGFVIEYDLNGAATSSSNITATYLADLAALSDIVSSPAYMRHNGKPVIEIWGMGIVTSVSPSDGIAIVTALKQAGYYVILGVQQAWHAELVENQTGYGDVFKLADMLQPWTVGSYDNDNYQDFHDGRQAVEDKNALQELGIASSIVVWPGGDNHNSNPSSPFNPDSRAHGDFYRKQLVGAVDLKPTFIFGAMFDENNEGTAIYPILHTKDLPTNQQFLGLDDDMAADAYLTMAGGAAANISAAWA
ncbi:hypothetical protein PG985_001062 [Apiospora marii]|uniref:Uncharacterized protein n=1 Tax=Apiospora marii TaxID=335849 RepID=A0ABR1RH88_9PEZI